MVYTDNIKQILRNYENTSIDFVKLIFRRPSPGTNEHPISRTETKVVSIEGL